MFPAFCGWESILGRESTDVIFCFHFLSSPFILHSFPLMFLSFCINFLSFCFHVLSCSVAMYQRYRSSKADMLKPVRCVSAQTLAFFHISWLFLLSFSYRFGGLCRLPSSGFVNMYMYKLAIVFFTLIVFWAGNALTVLRCKPSQNEMPGVIIPHGSWSCLDVLIQFLFLQCRTADRGIVGPSRVEAPSSSLHGAFQPQTGRDAVDEASRVSDRIS